MSHSTNETTNRTCQMIIFNQEDFETEEYRVGSSKDVASLKNTFSKFGIDPVEKLNFTLSQIEEEIEILSTKDFTGHKLFMCVLLTHGQENGIVSAKDKSFNLRKTIINPIIENATLNGIPKIFIIVACRGQKDYYFASDYLAEDGCAMSRKKEVGVDYSNVVICYSTYEGHRSWRNSRFGTYYIMELCKLIEENGTNVEFHLMLLELNKSLYGGRIQVAPFESTMKGQIHLNDLFNLNRGDYNAARRKTVVMCGQTGAGKSTLGNFILNTISPEQNTPFQVMYRSRSSPMPENVVATINMADFELNLIDTPGFGDTEGEQLNAMNVCNIWKALETDDVVAVLFLFNSRFDKITKGWYDRLLKAIPEQHHRNIFIVHTQYGGGEIYKEEDLADIRRLSGNPNAKISHVLNSFRLDDHREEILELINEWTSLPSFTVKNLEPPMIVYEKEELGPIEHRFLGRITVSELRTVCRQEKLYKKVGVQWRKDFGVNYGKVFNVKEDIYEDVMVPVEEKVQKEIEKERWVKFQNKYLVRYDKTRDLTMEVILEHYYRNIETITEQ